MTVESLPPNAAPTYGSPVEKQEVVFFEKTWQAPAYLRPRHKDALKQYFSFKQGRDGKSAICFFCKAEFGLLQLQIHHHDHNRKNNQLSNVAPACEPCNNAEKARWMSEARTGTSAAHDNGSALKKENDTDMQNPEKLTYNQLLKQAPPTFQAKVKYREETLAYLKQYVTETKSFEVATYDIETLTGCSHGKAIEYLNGFSMSVFAPWRQWTTQEGQWIAPREGSEAYRKVMGK